MRVRTIQNKKQNTHTQKNTESEAAAAAKKGNSPTSRMSVLSNVDGEHEASHSTRLNVSF